MCIKKCWIQKPSWKGPNRWNYNVFRVFPKIHKVGKDNQEVKEFHMLAHIGCYCKLWFSIFLK